MRKASKNAERNLMEISKDQLKKVFPNLAREMSDEEKRVKINPLRSDTQTAEKTVKSRNSLSNYDPDIIDFLRRCDSIQQAEEIIAYMQNRGEITRDYAKKLRQQLKKKGVRSFGAKKEEGYYFKVNEQ